MLGRAAYPFGYHFLIGLRPTVALADEDRRLLEDLQPAGVILFGGNFARGLPYDEWLGIYAELVSDIGDALGGRQFLLGIDHEGTGIVRPPEPITAFSYARHWAHLSAEVGATMGTELASLGINVNFAPVLDIDATDDSPVIGHRAFGTRAAEVVAAGTAFIEALHAHGVFACPKHFPGHGAAREDSHETLPVVESGLDQLRARELLPFEAAIRHNARMMMSAHLLFPQIDPHPATISPILHGVLRSELGFEGVLVTDDIGMPAMAGRFHDDGALEAALNSGTDLIMICDYWTETERSYQLSERIERGLARKTIGEAALARSRERIERLLSAAPRNTISRLSDDCLARHRAIAPLGTRSSTKLSESQTVRLLRE
jgi:beta-N-acetylhexosaminidase